MGKQLIYLGDENDSPIVKQVRSKISLPLKTPDGRTFQNAMIFFEPNNINSYNSFIIFSNSTPAAFLKGSTLSINFSDFNKGECTITDNSGKTFTGTIFAPDLPI